MQFDGQRHKSALSALAFSVLLQSLVLVPAAVAQDGAGGTAGGTATTSNTAGSSVVGATISGEASAGANASASIGANTSAAATNRLSAGHGAEITGSSKVLRGTVRQDGSKSPFLPGVVQTVPKGSTIDIAFSGTINSEFTQKGDEIMVQVSHDVAGSSGVGVPGGWYAHGLVTDSAVPKRGGRAGYISIRFDKLVSPDGQYEVPFNAEVSTKDSPVKGVAKLVAVDSGYVGLGALGGSILAVQYGGLGTAIATHGISVGVGAAIGGTIGLFGAIKRKGNDATFFSGDELKIVTADPISLPGFDKTALPSGKIHEKLKDMAITVNKALFAKDPSGDKASNLLVLDLTVANKTPKECTFCDLVVVSDHNQKYTPSCFQPMQQLQKKIKPNTTEAGTIAFGVDGKKRKYWLVLLDPTKENELTRVPIN